MLLSVFLLFIAWGGGGGEGEGGGEFAFWKDFGYVAIKFT